MPLPRRGPHSKVNIEWVHLLPPVPDQDYLLKTINDVVIAWRNMVEPRGWGWLHDLAILPRAGGQNYLRLRFHSKVVATPIVNRLRANDVHWHFVPNSFTGDFVECADKDSSPLIGDEPFAAQPPAEEATAPVAGKEPTVVQKIAPVREEDIPNLLEAIRDGDRATLSIDGRRFSMNHSALNMLAGKRRPGRPRGTKTKRAVAASRESREPTEGQLT
jgi:hypothetical protein